MVHREALYQGIQGGTYTGRYIPTRYTGRYIPTRYTGRHIHSRVHLSHPGYNQQGAPLTPGL